MKKLEHLSSIYKSYDIFIIDLWGVLHNGIRPNPEAMTAIEELHKNKKKYVFLSNAPRPIENVKNFLLKMGVEKKYLQNIFTSGEAALQSIKKSKFGKLFYHLGPDRDNYLYKGLEKYKVELNKCDYILCTGLFDEEIKNLNFYNKILNKYKDKIMVCTNPDLVVDRGDVREYCAGSIAGLFEKLGGKVIYFGKPHKEIYDLILSKNQKGLIIGDNLRTDIKGANNINQESLFILDGVHRDEISEEKNLDFLFKKYSVAPNFIQKKLAW